VLVGTGVESQVELAGECGGICICQRYACSQFHLCDFLLHFPLIYLALFLPCAGSFRFDGPFIFRSFFHFCVRSAFTGPS